MLLALSDPELPEVGELFPKNSPPEKGAYAPSIPVGEEDPGRALISCIVPRNSREANLRLTGLPAPFPHRRGGGSHHTDTEGKVSEGSGPRFRILLLARPYM